MRVQLIGGPMDGEWVDSDRHVLHVVIPRPSPVRVDGLAEAMVALDRDTVTYMHRRIAWPGWRFVRHVMVADGVRIDRAGPEDLPEREPDRNARPIRCRCHEFRARGLLVVDGRRGTGIVTSMSPMDHCSKHGRFAEWLTRTINHGGEHDLQTVRRIEA